MAHKCFCKSSKKVHSQYISVSYFCALKKKKVEIANGLEFFPPLTICEKKKKKFTLRLKLCVPSFCLELIFMAKL